MRLGFGEPTAPPRPDNALAFLEAVRQRQRRQLWLQGALAGAAGGLALLWIAGLVSNASLGFGRFVLVLAPLVAGALVAYFGWYRARQVVGDDLRTARLVGDRIPEVALAFLASVELQRELRRELERDPGFSPQLAKAFLDREDQRARVLDVAQVVDPVRTRRWLQAAGGAGLLLLVLFALTASSWTQGMGLALTHQERTQVAKARDPITGDIEVTYRYPAYTGLQPRTIAGTNGEISAPAGTEVVLKTRADREIDRAGVEVNGKPLPLNVQGRRDLDGTFVIDKAGSYAIVFFTSRGKEVARGPDTEIKIEADEAPKAAIRTPGEQLEVDPGEKVTLDYEASDDFGIGSAELVYRLPGKSDEQRITLPRDEGRRVRGQYTWDPTGKGDVDPGDRIQYRIEVKDNDAVAGPKVGSSRTHVLTLYSPAAHRRAALEKAEALWHKLVGLLADRLEGPDRDDPKDAPKVEAHAQVDQAGFALVGELRAGGEELSRQRDAPAELWAALANIAERTRQRLLATSDARRTFLRYHALQVPATAAGKRLTKVSETEVTGLEKDILYLESLIDRQKLEALKEMANELRAERRELASLIEQYKQTQDPSLRQDVLGQIAELRERINELMRRMQEMSQSIRDEHLNAEALQEMMEESSTDDALAEIEQLMREGKTDEALKKLQELSMQIDEMMQSLDEGSESFGGEEYAELSEEMRKFAEDFEKVQADQQKLADQTKAVRDSYREEMRERLRQRGAALKKELIKEAEQLQKDFAKVPGDELPADAERPLEEVRDQLSTLKNALEVDDFDLAAEASSQAAHSANELAGQGERQQRLDEMFERPQAMREKSRQVAQELNKDAERANEINRKLQELFPPPESMLSGEDKQRLRQLDQEQRQLQRRAQQLREQMESLEEEAPVFGQQGTQQMNEVAEKMGDAADRLNGRDPRRGHSEQKAALDQMQQMMKQMQQQQQGRGRGKMPFPMFAQQPRGQGGRNRTDKVDIPDENQFQAPKEFRKDLLDAMKEGTPDKYKEQVKRYYEELVK